MNLKHHSQQPVVLLSCAVFKNLLEKMIPDEIKSKVKFLDYGLHSVPKNLKIAVQEELDRIKDPSLVVLGYGLCGNGLDGIQAGIHTLLIPRADDCIAIFLGSYSAYRQEFDQHPGTYFLTKGWLESGSDPLMEYEKLIDKYGRETADWLMDAQYKHYRRLVFIAHSQDDWDNYAPRARKIGDYMSQWGIVYEEMTGSDQYFRQLSNSIRALETIDENFLIITPGKELTQKLFLRKLP
jgi:hypothetical protein